MKHALLFRDAEEPIVVSADDIKAGRYDRHGEYVDPEYEFKVEYVKAAKNGGGPYFRLYYSYEDYKRLCPERADRYQIIRNMRRYEESEWHTRWKTNVADFCRIEYTIPNKETRRWKIADAYYAEMKTCVEFQHSYISFHFEEKNEFYRALSLQTIWLYDLSNSNIKACADGSIEILEDNARGFFRISEKPDNLRDNLVYIQVKTGKIFRVTELCRRETSKNLESTIRYFWPSEIYDEQEFIAAIQDNSFKNYEDIISDRANAERQRQEREAEKIGQQREQEAERKAREEAERRAREEAERMALEEAERKAREEAERMALEEAERKAREETERMAREEAGRNAREEAERIAQEEAERKAREAAERMAREKAIRQQENDIRREMQYADYEQNERDVLDRNGRKWIRCKFCKKAVLFGREEVSSYIPNSNKGTCYDCRFKR